MRRSLTLLWLLLAAGAGAAVEEAPVLTAAELGERLTLRFDRGREISWSAFNTYRFQRGDDHRWAAREFDDSHWRPINAWDLPSRDGIYWVRCRITARDPGLAVRRDGLLFKVVASYDLYWDGHLLGRNGHASAVPDDELPGVVDALFQIPSELLGPGEHVVALRMSSFHTGFSTPTYGLTFSWGNFRRMLIERSRTAMFSVLAVGAALVVAVVSGLIWLVAGRRRELLLFSLLFLCVALLQALQAWRWLYEYPYDWHHPRLQAITLLATAIAVLLPAFVLDHFELGRRRWVFGILSGLLGWSWFSSPLYNRIGLIACSFGFGCALVLSVLAVRRGRRGARFACGGLALSVLALWLAPRDFLDHAFFLSAGPAGLGLLIALALQLREERREARQAVLTAARLEIELLKKNIQPHFLVNTLATLQEVIEQDPKAAVELIDALAAEFRILARVSGERLIPLADEIALCHAHLRVMSRRRGMQSSMRTEGVEVGVLVPPALLHTLVENGLTHLLPRAGRQDFILRTELAPGGTRFEFTAQGLRQPGSGAAGQSPATPPAAPEGTGLRYIKARLEESFTGAWSLASGPVPEGWRTTIEIRGAPAFTAGGIDARRALRPPGAPTP